LARITLAPLVQDVRGSLGSVYFANRYGQPILCRRTPPTNQHTPARIAQRDRLRKVASWWKNLPTDMQEYCDALAVDERISGYDAFVKRNLLDLGTKPLPVAPRILPLNAGLTPLDIFTEDFNEAPNMFYALWTSPWPQTTNFVRAVAVELDEEHRWGELCIPAYGPSEENDGGLVLYMPKSLTLYTVFLMKQTRDLQDFSVASSCTGTSGPAE